ncbi:hypothetical protein [Bacillus sp. T33-2]|uniref:hypothetical protein n=1 Tax=Bacillus sp. T33-2 TaxID=2054168 RepID=UPI000C79346E|nr:hypothetical protein [Bacillus sp. T33-2]PLR91940.1 hypothetical protein CVD19_21365 [Bacillus sp. T33-2]
MHFFIKAVFFYGTERKGDNNCYISLCWVIRIIYVLCFHWSGIWLRRKYADKLLEYKVPEKTEVIEQDFDYGVIYGGGPWGNGGYPTLVAYKRILTELSEKEIFDHYNTKDFEIYFKGAEELKKNNNNQIWYEGYIKKEDALSTEENNEHPIEVIIQYRTEFSYPFFIDFY